MSSSQSEEKSLAARLATSSVWTVSSNLAENLIGLVSITALGRILTPDDFGVIGVAMSVTIIFEMVSQFGFNLALIRSPGRDASLYHTAWTLTLIRSIGIAVLTAAAAKPAALFLDEPRIEMVLYALALGVAISGFENIGVVNFEKDLRFEKYFLFRVLQKLASVGTSVSLALLWRSYWAMVAGHLVQRLTALASGYWMESYRPRWSISRWRDLFDFSFWLMLDRFTSGLTQRADYLIIRKLMDSAAVGTYSVGRQVAETVTQGLVWAMSRTLYPGFSSVAANPSQLGRTYVMSNAVIFACGLPCAIGLMVISPDLVTLVFGDRWASMIPIVQGFCLAGAVRMMVIGVEPLLMTQGKTDVMFRRTLAVALTRPVLATLGIWWIGLEGVLLGVFAGVALYVIQSLFIIRGILFDWGRILFGSLFRSVIASVAMVCAILALHSVRVGGTASPAWMTTRLALDVCLGALTYGGTHFLVWKAVGRPEGAELRLTRLIANRFPSLARP